MVKINKLKLFPGAMYGILILVLSILCERILMIYQINSNFGTSGSFMHGTRILIEICIYIGFILVVVDFLYFAPLRRKTISAKNSKFPESDKGDLTVVLTAYNDEDAISDSVIDFKNHKNVSRVIVIDNNSTDRTEEYAKNAGAIVIREHKQGYGQCVYRSLIEGSKYTDTKSFILCEGDRTFRASDIDKFLSYQSHGEIINGTRIVEQLRESNTQLTSFIYIGNFAVAKLLQLKHLGLGTITDVGTTYKLCNSETIRRNIEIFNPEINHQFNAHFLDKVISNRIRLVEVPITFHKRVGKSKGGNSSNFRAIIVGIGMIFGIIFGWPRKNNKNAKPK